MRTITLGQIVPLGLSKRQDGYLLRLPLLAWYRTGYEVNWDAKTTGWWQFGVCIRFGRDGLRFRCGWTILRGDKSVRCSE